VVIDSILARWEAGGVTLDRLCQDHPSLRPEVERRVEALRAMAPWLTQGHTPGLHGDLAEEEQSAPALPGYELLGELGKGGMGVVYKARQTALNRLVAVKMVLAEGLLNPDNRARFQIEAEVIARLHHPNIVQIHEVGEAGGKPYLVLELIEGGNLHGRLRDRPLHPDEAARLVEQVADGTQHAHERGVIHRDLKPHNVLMGSDGVPRITDFGMAKKVDGGELTQSGQMMGTPCYMPPEQAAGRSKEIGPTADVYSLGAILYECLTGRPPFQGPSWLDVVTQVLRDEPVPPRRLQPTVPRDLETICLKCLEKSPGRRYPSAAALADDLRRFREGKPIQARPAGPVERAALWVRRHPGASGLIGAAVVCLVLAVTGLWLRQQALAASQLADANEELARTEAYYKTLAQVREQSLQQQPGWTWDNLERLRDAATHRKRDDTELRTLTLDAATGFDLRRVAEIGDGTPSCLAFSADGKRLAIARFGTPVSCEVHVYDVATWKQSARYSFSNAALAVRVNLMRFTSGRNFAGSPADRPNEMTFSPDGRWLVAGTRRGQVMAWDTTKGQEAPAVIKQVYQVKDADEGANRVDYVSQVFFSPDGRELFACAMRVPMTKCWDVADGWREKTNVPFRSARFASISPDGDWLSYHDEAHRMMYRRTGEASEVGRHPDWAASLITPGNQLIFIVDPISNCLNRLDRIGGNQFCIQDVRDRLGRVGRRLAQPPGAGYVLTSDSNVFRFWDLAQERVIRAIPVSATGRNETLALTPDGTRMAVIGETKTTVYELRRSPLTRLMAVGTALAQSMDVSPDGNSLAVNRGHTADIWDTGEGQLVRTVKAQIMHTNPHWNLPGNGNPLYGIAWHPDNDRVAWCSSWLGLMQISRSQGMKGLFSTRGVDNRGADISRGAPEPVSVSSASFKSIEAKALTIVPDPAAQDGRAVRLGPGQKAAVKLGELVKREVKAGEYLVGFLVRVERKGNYQTANVLETSLLTATGPIQVGVTGLWNIPDSAYHLYFAGRWTGDELRRRAEESLTIGNIAPADRVEAVWVGGLAAIPLGKDGATVGNAHEIGPLKYSPDGKELWGVSNYQHVAWDATTRAVRGVWDNRTIAFLSATDSSLTSLDTRPGLTVAANHMGNLILARPGEEEPVYVKGRKEALSAVALMDGGKTAAVGNGEGQVRVVRIPEGEVVTEVTAHQMGVTSLAYCEPMGLLVSGARDRSVVLWRWRNDELKEVARIKNLPQLVRSVRLDGEGRRLFVLLDEEYAVRVWELEAIRRMWRELGLDPWQ
jgi:WD40 repeat protein/predicted Ser/Thr protein kinase